MAEFVIRKATMMDIDTIMAVFESARAFMASRGNGEQWVGYPPPALAERDIKLCGGIRRRHRGCLLYSHGAGRPV